LNEGRLRDLLTSFVHLQSFYSSSGVRLSPVICRVPDRLTVRHLSATLSNFLTLGVPRCSLTTPMTYSSLVLVPAPSSSLRKISPRTRPKRVPLRNPAEFVHAAWVRERAQSPRTPGLPSPPSRRLRVTCQCITNTTCIFISTRPSESHLSHHLTHNKDYCYPSYPMCPPMVHPSAIDYSKRMSSHADYPRQCW